VCELVGREGREMSLMTSVGTLKTGYPRI
jgi:hypothetical protein